jgi:hypothetical protein
MTDDTDEMGQYLAAVAQRHGRQLMDETRGYDTAYFVILLPALYGGRCGFATNVHPDGMEAALLEVARELGAALDAGVVPVHVSPTPTQ